MNQRATSVHIRKAMRDWVTSVDDMNLRVLMERDMIVTGGCITSLLSGDKLNDYDVYFATLDTATRYANYALKELDKYREHQKEGIPVQLSVRITKDSYGNQSVGIYAKSSGVASIDESKASYEYFEYRTDESAALYLDAITPDALESAGETMDEIHAEEKARRSKSELPKYTPVFITGNAISLKGKIQVVTRFTGEPEKIHENFDFVHCTNYWTFKDGLVLNSEALASYLTKELRYMGSRFPLASIIRARKFIQRGWWINAGQILKMVLQSSELEWHDFNVLREQLMGVDAAYFRELLSKLEATNPETISSSYLVELIDKVYT